MSVLMVLRLCVMMFLLIVGVGVVDGVCVMLGD